MSSQRARSVVAARHRSIHPNIPGVPSWAAVAVAVTATAVGFAFDAGSGNKQLTHVFAALYVTGCVAAVLAVRQCGVFTAVIQPPLILFFSVPGAYWLFHGAKITGVRDILINCGYPLIERFPLMLFTSAAVLLIAVVRWYIGTSRRLAVPANAEADAANPANSGRMPGIAAKLAKLPSIFSRRPADKSDPETPADSRGGRTSEDRPKSRRSSDGRPGQRANSPRSRHSRRPLDDKPQSAAERPRRRPAPVRDFDGEPPPPRRRSRPLRDPDMRAQPPREIRRDPQVRRDPYQRPMTRGGRFDPYDPLEPYEAFRPPGPYEPYGPYETYEPYEPYEPRRRRSTSPGSDRPNSTHHPISQVRYRQSARNDEPSAGSRADRRPRRRPPPE